MSLSTIAERERKRARRNRRSTPDTQYHDFKNLRLLLHLRERSILSSSWSSIILCSEYALQ
jgi:hypothetical protein